MIFSFKAAVLAAVLAATTATHAAIVTATPGSILTLSDPSVPFSSGLGFLDGGQYLEFSNGSGVLGGQNGSSVGGVVGLLNVGQFTVTHLDEVKVMETRTLPSAPGRDDGVRFRVAVEAPVSMIAADDQTRQLLTIGVAGGFEIHAPPTAGLINGGHLTVTNLKADLSNKVMYADLHGQSLLVDGTLSPIQEVLNIPVWTIDNISGPTQLPPAGDLDPVLLATLGYTLRPNAAGRQEIVLTDDLRGLRITQEGFTFVSSALGLPAGGLGSLVLGNINTGVDGWGSIRVSTVFAAANVPEPGTWVLMAVGLWGIGIAMRRSRCEDQH